MNKRVSLLSNLLLSSTLFWGLPMAQGEELTTNRIVKVPTDGSNYCHMKFPPMREETLSWPQPVLDENAGHLIDFYGPCDYDPLGADEIKAQRRMGARGIFENGD